MNDSFPKRLRAMMLWGLLIAVSGYLIICVAVYFLQNRMVYHPTAEIIATPADWDIPYEDVVFQTEDKITLRGWFITGKDDAPVVLFCHGNQGNISGRETLLTIFHELGASVFIFDYRGYGKSEGRPSEEGTVRDVTAAWTYLTYERRIAPMRIVIFGRSLGAGVATHLASKVKMGGMILMSTFTALPDVGQKAYPFLPIRLLSKYKYPNLKHMRRIHAPVLILHSKDDETIPFSHGKALYEAAAAPKRFVALNGSHNDAATISRDRVKSAFQQFFSQL